jgi:hypothetical protein
MRYLITAFIGIIYSIALSAESQRIVLPDTIHFEIRDVNVAYDLAVGGDKRGLDQLEIIAERSSAMIMTEAHYALSRLEINGIIYEKNFTEALMRLISATAHITEEKSRISDVRKRVQLWQDSPINSKESISLEYMWYSYLRYEYRENKAMPHTGIIAPNPILSLARNEIIKISDPTFSDVTQIPSAQKYIPLRGIWKLADSGFFQAQYEIAMYLLQNPVENTISKEDRVKAINYLWYATFAGHKFAADQLLNIYRKTGFKEDLHTACSVYIAFRKVAKLKNQRRIRFSNSMPECGSLLKPRAFDENLRNRIFSSLMEQGIYYPSSGPSGDGNSIWEYGV